MKVIILHLLRLVQTHYFRLVFVCMYVHTVCVCMYVSICLMADMFVCDCAHLQVGQVADKRINASKLRPLRRKTSYSATLT